MADLISRSALMAHFKQDEWGTPDERWRPEREFGRMVMTAPAVEAEIVKHGRWVDAGDSKLHCTSCRRYIRRIVPIGYDYCPYCGAKMDKAQSTTRQVNPQEQST